MSSKENDDWLPLSVALAWTITRNHNALYQFRMRAKKSLAAGLDLLREVAPPPKDRPDNDVIVFGWLQLRAAIANGKVRARGEIFRPKPSEVPVGSYAPPPEANISSSDEDWDLDDESWIDIEPESVTGLMLEVSRSLRLRPENWVLEGGDWWQFVNVSKTDLLRIFKVKAASKTGRVRARPAVKHEKAKEAARALWGEEGPPTKVLCAEFTDEINKKLGLKGNYVISESTCERAVKELYPHRSNK